ncbi:hypothetical protein Syun_001326 [Stephania yunnanensis]|uniref:Cyclin N-terminal domain-containing protein n=1 Tax=Stephania yunnanensis TaxID=152371 RepID=A0AAP0LDW1_9MAGN
MEDSAVSLSSLLCTETESCLDESEDEGEFFNFNSDDSSLPDTHEYITMLVDREKSSFGIHGSLEVHEWLKCARLDAIKWILEVGLSPFSILSSFANLFFCDFILFLFWVFCGYADFNQKRAFFGFRLRTAYLSVNYLDRFLSKKCIDNEQSWAIGLLSIACLSIAVKMEECSILALTEFWMEDYNFESKVIQRMELLILITLDWRMCSITPFNYLHYFITKISDKSRPRDLAFSAVEFIFAMAKEFGLLDHRPSAIAAAAILAALNKGLTREMIESKMSFFSSCGSLPNEEVLSCYSLMQDIEVEKFVVPGYVISPDLSAICSSFGNFNEDSAITSVVTTKRRRLRFDDSDQNCESEKDKQH